jgi:hypothetical protein
MKTDDLEAVFSATIAMKSRFALPSSTDCMKIVSLRRAFRSSF